MAAELLSTEEPWHLLHDFCLHFLISITQKTVHANHNANNFLMYIEVNDVNFSEGHRRSILKPSSVWSLFRSF